MSVNHSRRNNLHIASAGFNLSSFLDGLFRNKTESVAAAAKEMETILVAGATGRLGSRIVRELIVSTSPSVTIRAGVRDKASAQLLIDQAVTDGHLSLNESRRIQMVEIDLTEPSTLPSALSGVTKVVCAAACPESGILDPSGPRRIDGDGTISLIKAARESGSVKQFVLVSSLGTGKFGLPAGLLNLFWGVLIQKRRAELVLEGMEEEEGKNMTWTIVRPGGMERPTDDYKATHNLRLFKRDEIFGGQVSRLQVAELVASLVLEPHSSRNRVIEVVAEITAPLKAFDELISDFDEV